MARDTGIHHSGAFGGVGDWEYYQKHPEFIVLVNDKISSKNYSIYKTKGQSYCTYYLVQGDTYKGKISGGIDKNTFTIKETDSKLKRGFYEIMFLVLLTMYNKLLSDTSLSTQAINSYTKLNKNKTKKFSIGVQTTQGDEEFSKELLLKADSNRVIIQGDQKYLNEFFDDYYKRINQTENDRPSAFRKMFLNKDETLDRHMFGVN